MSIESWRVETKKEVYVTDDKILQFHKDIMDLLHKHGYQSKNIKNVLIKCSAGDLPVVDISYIVADDI